MASAPAEHSIAAEQTETQSPPQQPGTAWPVPGHTGPGLGTDAPKAAGGMPYALTETTRMDTLCHMLDVSVADSDSSGPGEDSQQEELPEDADGSVDVVGLTLPASPWLACNAMPGVSHVDGDTSGIYVDAIVEMPELPPQPPNEEAAAHPPMAGSLTILVARALLRAEALASQQSEAGPPKAAATEEPLNREAFSDWPPSEQDSGPGGEGAEQPPRAPTTVRLRQMTRWMACRDAERMCAVLPRSPSSDSLLDDILSESAVHNELP
mmetsp:Transcript_64269/g.199383  ORF Transcript_64269/g.199383 Transcript_64269/m.199383 type:complete len:267 (-) Transcript_64269:275-1075(-)